MSSIGSLGSSMSMTSTAAMKRPDRQQMFNKVDTDGGGTIDKVELSAFAKGLKEKTGIEINTEEALTTYDADGDSALSQEEMDAMMAASMPVPPPPPMMQDGETQGMPEDGMRTMGMRPPNKEEMFSKIDSDSSGTINADELTSFLEQLKEDTGIELNAEDALATYDTDGDGALSMEEMDNMMAANMPEPPPTVSSKAITAYNQNSGEDDLMATLLSMLGESTDDETYSALNVKG